MRKKTTQKAAKKGKKTGKTGSSGGSTVELKAGQSVVVKSIATPKPGQGPPQEYKKKLNPGDTIIVTAAGGPTGPSSPDDEP